MTSHIVVGAGEVGTAVSRVLSLQHPTTLRDLDPVEAVADVLDVCIPWSDRFVEIVKAYQEEHGASLVVIHSTVPVGTCDANGWVHSPIRGRHPHLFEGVRTFTKHFGGNRAEEAARDWSGLVTEVKVHESARDTEAGKLWELAQYGLQVRVTQAIYEWCQANDVDPDVAYREFAETYNAGYAELGWGKFVRPVLDYVPGPIGGHCVTQNSYHLDHWITEVVRGEL